MEKQTKNIITREWVEKELRFYNTADIRSTLVLCGALSLLFVLLTVGLVWGFFALFKNIWLKILLSVLMGGLTSAPVWINLLSLIVSLKERKLLNCGEFDIVTRDVSYKSEKMVYRHIQEYLHFSDFKEFSVGHTTFQLASAGDTFYIVHYNAKKDIKLLYSAKMYELQ